MALSILYDKNRHQALAPELQKIVRACEQTTFDCVVDNLQCCENYLADDIAYKAALIGTISGLACIIAQSGDPKALAQSVGAVLEIEIASWADKLGEARNASA